VLSQLQQINVGSVLEKGNFRQFGKRYAIRIDDFERSIISHSLTKEELKKAFNMMDRNNGMILVF